MIEVFNALHHLYPTLIDNVAQTKLSCEMFDTNFKHPVILL